MNVTVYVECFKMLIKTWRKTLFKKKWLDPFYQRIRSKSQSYWCHWIPFLAAVLSWDIEFLGVQSQTSRNYIQVSLPPICRCFQKITTENRLWCSISFSKTSPFSLIQAFTGLQHFSKASPAFVLQLCGFFCFLNGWISTRIVLPKNSDRNIKCPSVSARACHPSCCTLVSSDERQPPNMWQGHGPCAKWFGNAQYIQFLQCLAFQTCNLRIRYPFAMLI